MTREEAIEQLKQIPIHDAVSDDYMKSIYESIDIAIKALKQEPCDDAISRQAVFEQIAVWIISGEYGFTNATDYLSKKIKALPSVTPQQRTGQWIDDTSLGYHVSICSNCDWRGHGDTCLIYRPKYCPNCGAKMEESQESEVQE